MDAQEGQETSERDQLWANLRRLRGEIDRLAAGEFNGTQTDWQMVFMLARIVAAEMDFRARNAAVE